MFNDNHTNISTWFVSTRLGAPTPATNTVQAQLKAKKKWSKGKVKDKAQHAVILDKATSDKLAKDVQSYRLVSVAVLVDRLKINGSLARRALADLEAQGTIKKVVGHSKCTIYSMWIHIKRTSVRILTDLLARAVAGTD